MQSGIYGYFNALGGIGTLPKLLSPGRTTAQEAGYLPIARSENSAKLLLCLEFEAKLICRVQGRSEIFQNFFALPLDLY